MHLAHLSKATQLAAKKSHDTIGKEVHDALSC
jgi:hypothetical protein